MGQRLHATARQPDNPRAHHRTGILHGRGRNPKAPAVDVGAAQVAQITQWMKNAVTLDWDSVNANRPAWNARWNKTIER